MIPNLDDLKVYYRTQFLWTQVLGAGSSWFLLGVSHRVAVNT